MLSEEPRVTIVVVPRERFSFAPKSLESIYANTEIAFKLVYVDGGSPSYMRKYLEQQSKARGFELIRTEYVMTQNESRNLGASRVTTPYMAIVDNDVLVTPGWLSALVNTAARTGAAVVGPLTLEGPLELDIVHTIGAEAKIFIDEKGVRRLYKRQALHQRPLAEVRDQIRPGPCDLVEIHAVLVNTEKFRALGGFDEQLATNHEHLDLCIRARQAGEVVYLEPASVVSFVPGPPFKWSDYPFYLTRWNDAWNHHTNRQFYAKFGAAPEDGAIDRHNIFVTDRRRRLALENGLLRWLRPWMRRKSDQQYRPWAVRLMTRVEKWVTRSAMKRRKRLMPRKDASAPNPAAARISDLPSTNEAVKTGHVAMFHIGRCGSTVLGDLLNQHPMLHWDGEIYEPGGQVWSKHATAEDRADPIGFLRKRLAEAAKPRYGCEVKFYQARLVNLTLETLVARLDELGFSHFIVLRRRNYLRKVASSLVASASRKWHLPAGSTATLERVRVPVDAVPIDHGVTPLVDLLRGYDADLQRIEELLRGRPTLQLTYEDDIEANPRAAYSKVCGFIGSPESPANIRLERTTPFPLREVIENFDEVAAALRGTPYEWMIDA